MRDTLATRAWWLLARLALPLRRLDGGRLYGWAHDRWLRAHLRSRVAWLKQATRRP
jgi:hypothetical protein